MGAVALGCGLVVLAIGACGDDPGGGGGRGTGSGLQPCDTDAACLGDNQCCFPTPDAATGVCQEICQCIDATDCGYFERYEVVLCCSGVCMAWDNDVDPYCRDDLDCDPGDTCDYEQPGGGLDGCFGLCVPDGSGGGGGGAGGAGGGPIEPIVAGDFPTLDAPEAPSILDYMSFQIFSVFEDDNYVAIAGGNGQRIHRLSDGSVAHDFTTMNNGATYAAVGANNALVTIGPDGYAVRGYDLSSDSFSAFQQLLATGRNFTGIAPIPTASGASVHGMILADNTLNGVYWLDPLPGPAGGFTTSAQTIQAPDFASGLVTGSVVHVYSPTGVGPIIGINEALGSFDGQLWHATTTQPSFVADIGQGPRRIDCLEPAGTPCAISNYLSGSLTLVDWPDRAQEPVIGTTTVPVGGPIGIDIALVEGQPTVVSTGFNDDTVHLTVIGPGLTPTDQSFALRGCSQPGHAMFLPGATHILVTCNGSDNYQVHELPLAL